MRRTALLPVVEPAQLMKLQPLTSPSLTYKQSTAPYCARAWPREGQGRGLSTLRARSCRVRLRQEALRRMLRERPCAAIKRLKLRSGVCALPQCPGQTSLRPASLCL
eukprot:6190780-Pleurochrysis_carterae.AAC.8